MFSSKTPTDTKPFTYMLSAVVILCLFLNINFYPQLLSYQGGQKLADQTKGKINLQTVYFWKNNYSSSYCFATKTLRKELPDPELLLDDTSAHLIYDIAYEKEITTAGWVLGNRVSVKDFEITKLDKQFADPKTRETHCSKLVMAEILFFRKP